MAPVDQMTTVRRERIGRQIGRLDQAGMVHLNQAILAFL
ncbi:MAG: type II toxin-antitoxin system PemK/MazF family toxin [SAR202 cluster bacterium]|nr:type II toxin-antitoxin system PemK/MazF family toxin [SAR202 cluster bacterium]